MPLGQVATGSGRGAGGAEDGIAWQLSEQKISLFCGCQGTSAWERKVAVLSTTNVRYLCDFKTKQNVCARARTHTHKNTATNQTNPTIHAVCQEPKLYFKMEDCLPKEVMITEIKWGIIVCSKAFRMQFVWSAPSESKEKCHVSCDNSKRTVCKGHPSNSYANFCQVQVFHSKQLNMSRKCHCSPIIDSAIYNLPSCAHCLLLKYNSFLFSCLAAKICWNRALMQASVVITTGDAMPYHPVRVVCFYLAIRKNNTMYVNFLSCRQPSYSHSGWSEAWGMLGFMKAWASCIFHLTTNKIWEEKI